MELSHLESQIKYYATKYYDGQPEISDEEFDKLIENLRRTNPNSSILKSVGWGYDPTSSIGTKKHHVYGLVKGIDRKPRRIEDLPMDFRSYTPNMNIEAKLDGLSGVSYFRNGKFYLGLTRGNGYIGIDRTDKFINIFRRSNLLSSIPEDFTGAVRGEFVISQENWKKFQQVYPESSNARNTAAGIINSNEIDERINYVDYVVYKIIAEETSKYSVQNLYHLSRWFDKVVPYTFFENEVLFNQKELEDIYKRFNNIYPCDGVVLSKILYKKQSEVVYDEVAYKFDKDPITARVTGIDWKRSRLGKIVPTVLIEPTEIDGSIIKRTTGFNAKYIDDNWIGKDAIITLHKGGDIIPDIDEVLEESPHDNVLPIACPCCHSYLKWKGVNLVCDNPNCEGQDSSDLHVWCDNIASVDGLGWSIRDKFFTENNINTIEDLYNNESHIIHFTNSATDQKLKEMMYRLTNTEYKIDPRNILCALNIPRLGWKTADKIVRNDLFSIIQKYNLMSELDFMTVINESVGYATAKTINDNRSKLERLKFIETKVGTIKSNPERDKSESLGEVMITGKLSMVRKKFEEIIINAGYTIGSKVHEGTTYLITNTPDSSSSKNKKANELGIKKITEEEFLIMIGEY